MTTYLSADQDSRISAAYLAASVVPGGHLGVGTEQKLLHQLTFGDDRLVRVALRDLLRHAPALRGHAQRIYALRCGVPAP